MALSDTLFEAAQSIRQDMKTLGHLYDRSIQERVDDLLEEMDAIRMLPGLDTAPEPHILSGETLKPKAADPADANDVGANTLAGRSFTKSKRR
jgi:hypothetical protein